MEEKKTTSDTKQPILIQGSMKPEKKKAEVIAITTEEKKHLLVVGNETIEISSYESKGSSDGLTELHVTIKGETIATELLANSKE